MTKEQLTALGLDDAAATKVAAASAEELKMYVAKTTFDEIDTAKKTLEGQVKEHAKQLDILKKSTGDAEMLKGEITKLQEASKEAKTAYDTQLKDLQFTNAIKLAIADRAQDVDLVTGLFDKTKLIFGTDGKITGLDEQVKTLKESKSFLFKPDTTANKPGYNPTGGQSDSGVNPFAKDTFNLTKQGEIFKTNPAEAKALAAAAGVEF